MVDANTCATDSLKSDSDLTIQILDVGQGDGIYIEFPADGSTKQRTTMLVDMGSLKNRQTTAADVIGYFATHTKFKDPHQTLDYLVITHADQDHYNGVMGFLDALKIKVRYFLHGGNWKDYSKEFQRFVADTLQENGTKILKHFTKFPTTFSYDGAFDLLNQKLPDVMNEKFGGVYVMWLAMMSDNDIKATGDPAWRKNTASIVMQLRYSGRCVILAGDATHETESFILEQFASGSFHKGFGLKSDVLKVAHHGSARTSTSRDWVKEVRPSMVFISSDRHGTMNAEKKMMSGYRLPQELCLDIIRKYTLLDEVVCHSYVSSYDPDDYVKYNKDLAPKCVVEPQNNKGNTKARWLEVPTKDAIFTTLAAMDDKQADESEADQGVQYEIRISHGGQLTVCSTYDFKKFKELAVLVKP